ncbi:SPOR domain-containing protein [Metabacillus sp. KIGAM252]|uniref:SPOR domain-containing protein n=1 Tax=Metabacillus flavus TaxID=2823519 RepID=A0ABS5LGL5_9BACI|nr:SPOR domain-containing protein [Metabacillus flavus]MBS2969883.1 SPOR domain-containing protein [Metabacillus flavus]
MDKQQNKGRTIKIRMNGEPESRKETIIPFTSWEENAAREAAASAEPEKEEFQWILPDDEGDVYEEDPKVIVQKKEKKKGFSFPSDTKGVQDRLFPIKQFLFTVIVAVVLGISFGFIALNVISNDDMPAAAKPADGGTDPGEPAPPPSGETPSPVIPSAAGKIAAFVVQNGKFSSRASAEEVAGELKSSGYAAVVREENGAFYVYGGIGFSKEETSALSKAFQENQVEAWGGKQTEWPVSSTGNSSEALQKAAGRLSAISLQVISGGKPEAEQIKTASDDISRVKEDSALKKNLLSAAKQLSMDSSAASGWKAQQLILDGLNAGK